MLSTAKHRHGLSKAMQLSAEPVLPAQHHFPFRGADAASHFRS